MTVNDAVTPRPSPTQGIVAAVLALAGHALAFGGGFLAARVVAPSEGGGLEDVAAAVVTFFGVELVLALACLIVGVVFLVRGRRPAGLGLIGGWVLGLVATIAVFAALT